MPKNNIALLKIFRTDLAGELRSAPRTGLQRVLMLRTLVAATGLLGAIVFDAISPLDLPLSTVMALLLGIALSLAAGLWRVRHAVLITPNELALHLSLDFLFLTALLVYTGGAANPLISYLLVLLAVSATLLSTLWANLFALLAITIYTVLLVADLLTNQHSAHMPGFQLHLVGMWVTFVVSAAVITVFVGRMAAAIRSRELTLARSRENELRNEQLIAIGTLAAGTAHALGTPLSTMSVLLSELDRNNPDEPLGPATRADLRLLREQVRRCVQSLDDLTRLYHRQGRPRSSVSVAEFHTAIRDYVVNIHPHARLKFDLPHNAESLMISGDITLRHALINIIENAIRAATHEVQVSYMPDPATDDMLQIDVKDDGPGVPARVMENMGEPFISTRPGNMGLGIFLANASIQRHGGTIEMFNLKQGGAHTLVRLPVAVEDHDNANKGADQQHLSPNGENHE